MKIILIGATGIIGQKVYELLKTNHEVIPVEHKDVGYQVDIADKDSIQDLFEQIGEIDAVICTTGLSAFGSLNELTDEQYYLGWNNELMGQINILRVGQTYIRDGGVVLFTTGMLANEPIPGSAATSAVNGALNSFVKAVSLVLGEKLRVNAISPVFVKETLEKMGMDNTDSVCC